MSANNRDNFMPGLLRRAAPAHWCMMDRNVSGAVMWLVWRSMDVSAMMQSIE